MSNFFRSYFLLILSTLCLSQTIFSASSPVFHRSFLQPMYHGQRLNYCMLDGKCGLPVASRYCQIMGYQRADHQIIANNVGLSNYLGLRPVRCVGWQCNGFKTIRCRGLITHKPPKTYHYRLRRYVFPRFNNYRVDWCYDGKNGCGRKAAYSFCRRLGYMSVKSYKIEKNITATQAIGNQKLCFGKECKAFGEINCYR